MGLGAASTSTRLRQVVLRMGAAFSSRRCQSQSQHPSPRQRQNLAIARTSVTLLCLEPSRYVTDTTISGYGTKAPYAVAVGRAVAVAAAAVRLLLLLGRAVAVVVVL